MAAAAVRAIPAPDRVLVVGDPQDDLATSLRAAGARVTHWDRRVRPERSARPWPPQGPFDLVAMRLPRSKEELDMALHAAASVLEPTGSLLLFGANDEGIKSVARRLWPMFDDTQTVTTGGHCRVITAALSSDPGSLRDHLGAWHTTFDPKIGGLSTRWVGYPGVFSHGTLDPGSALLIEALPTSMSGLRALDYGAGTGVLGGVCRERGCAVDLLDVDTVALEAARQNVEGARLVPGSSLDAVAGSTYDLIVSNPPIHRGKAETHDVLEALVAGAPQYLVRDGAMYMVVQKRVTVESAMESFFGRVERIAEDPVFKVLRARRR